MENEIHCTDEMAGQPRQTEDGQPGPQAAKAINPIKISAVLLIKDLGHNLLASIFFLLLHKGAITHLRATVPQFVLFFVLGLLCSLGLSFLSVGWEGEFNYSVLPYYLWQLPLIMFCSWCCARVNASTSRAMEGAVAIIVLSLPLAYFQAAFPYLPESFWSLFEDSAQEWVAWLPFTWFVLASYFALIHLYCQEKHQEIVIFGLVVVLLIIPTVYISGNYAISLWSEKYNDEKYEKERERWDKPMEEAVLYRQPELLDQALANLQNERPGVPDLYLVAFGGTGEQDVFLREVLKVDRLFSQRFDTAGRSVILINNSAMALKYPVASVTALQRTLEAIAKRMNKDEDVLFLFMTSHGSRNHKFSLSLGYYRFDDLTPQSLRQMLDASGIKNRVIVVSACYSGGFIPPLANENTLVISASRADRNSLGCSNGAEWTFFGRAYFDEALRHGHSFTAAFEKARQRIAEREEAGGYKQSEPQISEGAEIRKVLAKIEQRLIEKEKHKFGPDGVTK